MSGAQQRDLSPESWDLGDRFLLEQGFAVAFLGWQFDVEPSQGLTFQAPIAPVEGLVRETHIESRRRAHGRFGFTYCASDPRQPNATLTFRARMDAVPRPMPRDTWQFAEDGCSARLSTAAGVGIYEVVYQAKGIAGGRSRPGSDSRLRVVSPLRRGRRHSARNPRPLSSGSSATATRRAGASCASSFATASTPTSAAGRRSMR